MPRPEKPIPHDGGAIAEFARDLRDLRRDSGLTYKQMATTAYYSVTVLSQAAAGHRLPTWEVTAKFVEACGGDAADWMTRWEQARLELEKTSPADSHRPRMRKLAPVLMIAIVMLSAALVIALVSRGEDRSGPAGPPAELPVDTRPIDLTALAPGATWRSGAGALPFPGSDIDDRGFVLTRPLQKPGACEQSADNATTVLETHPQWVDNGFIEGVYRLPRPIVSGDRFRAKVGFRDCTRLVGDVVFSASVVMPNGEVREVATRQALADGGPLAAIEADLSPYAGAQILQLSVKAGASSEQDWAIWAGPRIGG